MVRITGIIHRRNRRVTIALEVLMPGYRKKVLPERSGRLAAATLALFAALIASSGAGTAFPAVSAARTAGGAVASACPEATAAGVRVLREGGNAVDAAVATGFALAVAWPSAGNIGGGGFLTAMTGDGRITFIDFREKAPMKASRDMYVGRGGEVVEGMSTLGHAACGVPGSVAGLYEAWKMHGSMPWKDLLDPAIELAKEGFEVDEHLAASLARLEKYLSGSPGLEVFTGPDGRPLAQGSRLVQPELAAVLERIADQGRDGFYAGRVASLIAEEMSRGGGLITLQDLAAYRAVPREPVRGTYRGYEIISAPPPSSGGVILLEMLNVLEGLDLAGEGPDSDLAAHWMIETERRAYRDRAVWLGDPDFVDIPMERLLSKEYAAGLRKGIGRAATPSSELPGNPEPVEESEETTHYSIVDPNGWAVAVTTTLNTSFGSKVVVRGAGFLMNNEMDDFSVKPGVPNVYGLVGGEANSIAPGKRMLSSMTPSIVLKEGKPFLVLGTPGGSTIITTVLQLIVDVVDFGMTPERAVSSPRLHNQWLPDRVYYEEGSDYRGLLEGLAARGHELEERTSIGDAQLIMIDDAGRCAVSDPRHGGMSAGTDDPVQH